MSSPTEIILFDLGGVLVELDQRPENTCWFDPNLTPAQNWHNWLTDPNVQRFEQGLISAESFATDIIANQRLNITVDQFYIAFKKWVVGFYPEVWSLLEQLAQHYKLAVFSNISELHWPPLFQKLKQQGLISDYFASYLIHRAKPDPDSFLFVAEQMEVKPDSVLFLDDNILNVKGATKAGMKSAVVKGPGKILSTIDNFNQ